MKTAAGRPGRRLNGRKPRQAQPSASASDEHDLGSGAVDGVDREERARDRGERRREAVHVVEQVERVRDPDEPDEREREREHVVGDDLDREPGREHDRRGRELGCELRDGRSE